MHAVEHESPTFFRLQGQMHYVLGEARFWQYRELFYMKHYFLVKAAHYYAINCMFFQALVPDFV